MSADMWFSVSADLEVDAAAVGEVAGPGRLGSEPYELELVGSYAAPIYWRTQRSGNLLKVDIRFADGDEASTYAFDDRLPPGRALVAMWGRPELIMRLYHLGEPAPEVSGPRPRLRECVERWPGAEVDGDYDPRCCRWPKSCSASVYRDDIDPALLESGRW